MKWQQLRRTVADSACNLVPLRFFSGRFAAVADLGWKYLLRCICFAGQKGIAQMIENMIKPPTSFEDALARMSDRESVSVVVRLRDFSEANMMRARKAAERSETISDHAFQTGQAAAFDAVFGYCKLELAKLSGGEL